MVRIYSFISSKRANRFCKARNKVNNNLTIFIMKINIIKNTKIENTPFTILTNEDGKSMISVGNQIVTQPKETEDECIKMIENKDWELILNASFAFHNLIKNLKDEDEDETSTN